MGDTDPEPCVCEGTADGFCSLCADSFECLELDGDSCPVHAEDQ